VVIAETVVRVVTEVIAETAVHVVTVVHDQKPTTEEG
jgi:hypothetical protein